MITVDLIHQSGNRYTYYAFVNDKTNVGVIQSDFPAAVERTLNKLKCESIIILFEKFRNKEKEIGYAGRAPQNYSDSLSVINRFIPWALESKEDENKVLEWAKKTVIHLETVLNEIPETMAGKAELIFFHHCVTLTLNKRIQIKS